MLSEFDLIKQYFVQNYASDPRFALGIGDDCALINPSKGMQLAISTDMLVSGRHFFPDADPVGLGHKCLAVNLSDLAAMGAKPLAFTLALSLPEANPTWLAGFSQGLLALAQEHNCRLIGGDTTKGPLNICITIFGELPPETALRRDAAQVGDGMKFCTQAYFTINKHWLIEFKFFNTVVDHHFNVPEFGNLIP